MGINTNQITAARALLGWSQQDLANHSGFTRSSISGAEKGDVPIQSKVIKVIEEAGVEFIEEGVRKKASYSIIFDHPDTWYMDLLDYIHKSLRADQNHSTMKILFGDDGASPSKVNNKLRYMRDDGIKMQQIVEQENTYIMGALNEYRYFPKKYFTNIPMILFGDKIAMCIGNNTRAIVRHDRSFAKVLNGLFDGCFHEKLDKPTESTADERF